MSLGTCVTLSFWMLFRCWCDHIYLSLGVGLDVGSNYILRLEAVVTECVSLGVSGDGASLALGT